jgi:hypothetical protein
MRKSVVSGRQDDGTPPSQEWLDLESLAQVELTSEDPEHPVESALVPGGGAGWRAAEPGAQTVRLRFDRPQPVSRVRLEFHEPDIERTQEYVLRASSDGGRSFRELVRQQWNFSPGGTTTEVEEHHVDLAEVDVLELEIVPDVSRGSARASLASLRLA